MAVSGMRGGCAGAVVRGSACQVCSGRVWIRVNAATRSVVHGQVAERRQMCWRPVVMEMSGGVEQAVAEPFGFGGGELAVEGEQAGDHAQLNFPSSARRATWGISMSTINRPTPSAESVRGRRDDPVRQ